MNNIIHKNIAYISFYKLNIIYKLLNYTKIRNQLETRTQRVCSSIRIFPQTVWAHVFRLTRSRTSNSAPPSTVSRSEIQTESRDRTFATANGERRRAAVLGKLPPSGEGYIRWEKYALFVYRGWSVKSNDSRPERNVKFGVL